MIVKPSMFIKILTKCILKVLSWVIFKLIILLYFGMEDVRLLGNFKLVGLIS